MKGINKAIIIGTLGADPEVRYSSDGKAIANLSVATSESWKDKQGAVQERTEWHRVSIFGKLAEIAGQYLKKGSKVYLEGKIKTRKWQDQQGNDKYTTEIVLSGFDCRLEMLGGNPKNESGNQNAQGSNRQRSNVDGNGNPYTPEQMKQLQGQEPPDFDFDDEVPF